MTDNYHGGYVKALLDIKGWIEQHSDAMKVSKMFNQKKILALLQGFIDNKDLMMKYGDNTELVITKDGKVISLEEFERNKNELKL